MLKELKAAADRGMAGEFWTSVMSTEAAPLPPNMFIEDFDEPERVDGAAKKSPKKSGKGTLRGMATATSSASVGPQRAKAPSNGSITIQDADKSVRATGLAGAIPGEPKEGGSLEDSPPPPPPTESASLSDSSVPPPPPTSDSGAQSSASSPVPPPPPEISESSSLPPPAPNTTPPPSMSSVSTSTEPADAETYISATMAREKHTTRKATVSQATTATNDGSSAKPTQAPAVIIAPAAIQVPTPLPSAKKTATPAPKLVLHELPQQSVKIAKDSIDETPPMETSALSKLLGPTDVEVWVPGAKSTISVRILPSATMQQLIINTIKTHNNATPANEKLLDVNPEAYNVRIATPNGQIEDMFPVLARKGTVDQWAEVAFILVENPNYKPNEIGTTTHKTENSEKSSTSATAALASSTALPSTAEKHTIRVVLPNGAYHTLLAESSMKLSKLLLLICEKRKMIPTHYTLTTMEKEYLSPNMRVQDLKDFQLVLEAKTDGNPIGPPTAEEIFYNDNVAAQYKLFQNISFHVKNKKKFGHSTSKQEPVSLGIDGTKFEIIFTKRTSNATFAYAISDLKSVSHLDDTPLLITIETIKERDKLLFEATTASLALEITAKVLILIDQANKDPGATSSTLAKAQ